MAGAAVRGGPAGPRHARGICRVDRLCGRDWAWSLGATIRPTPSYSAKLNHSVAQSWKIWWGNNAVVRFFSTHQIFWDPQTEMTHYSEDMTPTPTKITLWCGRSGCVRTATAGISTASEVCSSSLEAQAGLEASPPLRRPGAGVGPGTRPWQCSPTAAPPHFGTGRPSEKTTGTSSPTSCTAGRHRSPAPSFLRPSRLAAGPDDPLPHFSAQKWRGRRLGTTLRSLDRSAELRLRANRRAGRACAARRRVATGVGSYPRRAERSSAS